MQAVAHRQRRLSPSATPRRHLRGTQRIAGVSDEISVQRFCRTYGVTRDAFTRLSGFSPRAVALWASGKQPGGSAQKRFRELNRLFEALSTVVETEAIAVWLNQPNRAFDGSTPLQVIERGETDRIWRMIWALQSGNTG